MGRDMRKPWLVIVADPLRCPLEHGRPRGERPALPPHGQQHRPATRSHQPPPLAGSQRRPARLYPVDAPAGGTGLRDDQRFSRLAGGRQSEPATDAARSVLM